MKRRRKQYVSGKLVIIASSIVMLNLFGVSYAAWNDSLDMNASISTGFIKPAFEEPVIEIGCNTKGQVSARITDENVLEINGEVYPGFRESILVRVKNKGTLPIIYQGKDKLDCGGIIKNIEYFQYFGGHDGTLGLKDEALVWVNIEADDHDSKKKPTEVVHSFSYDLDFVQSAK